MNDTVAHVLVVGVTTAVWLLLALCVPIGLLRLYNRRSIARIQSVSNARGDALSREWALILGGGHLVFQVLVFLAFVATVVWRGYAQATDQVTPDIPEHRHWFDTLRRFGLSLVVLVVMVPLHGSMIYSSFLAAKSILFDSE